MSECKETKKNECPMKDLDWDKAGLFAAGVAFGTAGIKILTSKDAKKAYTHITAAVLRAKECVMKTVTKAQENAEDIYEKAQEINDKRVAEEEASIFEDEFCFDEDLDYVDDTVDFTDSDVTGAFDNTEV